MQFFRTNKTLLIGALVALFFIGGVYYYYSSSKSDTVLVASNTPSGTGGSELLVALSNLNAVSLDSSLFSDPVFRSLNDFGISIPAQPVGRPDPFAPLSVSSPSSSALPQNIKSGTAKK